MQGSDLEVFAIIAVACLVQEFCEAIRAREIPAFLTARVEHRGTPDARVARVRLEPDAYNVRVVVHGIPLWLECENVLDFEYFKVIWEGVASLFDN